MTSPAAAPETRGEYWCHWSENANGAWETECSNVFEITSETPTENSMYYCCYCGGRLMQHRYDPAADNDEDDTP